MKEDLSTAYLYLDRQASPGIVEDSSYGSSWTPDVPVVEEVLPVWKPTLRQGSSRSPVSIREVARRVGISHSTVSLVLRNDPRISAPTRAKVLHALEEMHYRPDPTFHALARSSRSRAVACVALIEPNHGRLSEDCRKGLSAAAEQFGYDVETFTAAGGPAQADLHRQLSQRGVRAIILSPLLASCEWRDFPWDHYAVVKIGNPVPGPKFYTVGEDEWLSAVTAFGEIRNRGYQRIGMVSRLAAADRFDPQFLNGFLLAQQSVSRDLRLEVFSPGTMGEEARGAAFSAWLASERPDVILTDLEDADWISAAAASLSVGVVFCSAAAGEGKAGVLPARATIGEVAFNLLRSLLHDCCYGEPGISYRQLIEGRWVEGESLPARRPREAKLPETI